MVNQFFNRRPRPYQPVNSGNGKGQLGYIFVRLTFN
jgi:hypothetical protein